MTNLLADKACSAGMTPHRSQPNRFHSKNYFISIRSMPINYARRFLS